MKTWVERKINGKWVRDQKTEREIDSFYLKMLVDDLTRKEFNLPSVKSVSIMLVDIQCYKYTIKYSANYRRCWELIVV